MKTHYMKISSDDVALPATVKLSADERRILARSGLPGTELYLQNCEKTAPQARVKLILAMLGAGSKGKVKQAL